MNPSNPSLHLFPPFHAEHIGSLLRPEELKRKRQLYNQKRCSQEDLKEAEDQAVKEVVKMQHETGLKTITDGEMRREVFSDGVFDKLEGMKQIFIPITELKPYLPFVKPLMNFGMKQISSYFCNGKIKRTKGFYVEDFKYLRSLVAPEDVKNIKITMCSPMWMHNRRGSLPAIYDQSIYHNDDEYFQDIGIAYQEEIKDLYDLGCRSIQLDNPTFCHFCNQDMLAGMEEDGIDHEAIFETYIRAINYCSKDRPSDLALGVHVCRGNWPGPSFPSGSYERISVKLFNHLDVDAFYLEYDTERAGDFTPLRHFPLNKTAILGLVTTKKPLLETMDELKERVNQAVDAMCDGNPKRSREAALNQLCISTQCGFATGWIGNPITEEDQKKKLSLVVETAKQIWKY